VDNPTVPTAGLNSGVINYINKFSEAAYKSLDPVSELFLRVDPLFQASRPDARVFGGLTTDSAGRLPGVSSWSGPAAVSSARRNFIIAINDANPWLDKKLPARSSPPDDHRRLRHDHPDGADFGEPSNADPDINVTDLTNRVGAMEGLNGSTWANSGTWTSSGAN
jgi:type IV pilus assembly protein PilY1